MEEKVKTTSDRTNSTKWEIRRTKALKTTKILSLETRKLINKVPKRTSRLRKTLRTILPSEEPTKAKLEAKENKIRLPTNPTNLLLPMFRDKLERKPKLNRLLKNETHQSTRLKLKKLTPRWRIPRKLPLKTLLRPQRTVLRSNVPLPTLLPTRPQHLNLKIDLPPNPNDLSETRSKTGVDVSKRSAIWLSLKNKINPNRKLPKLASRMERSNTFKMETNKRPTNRLSDPRTRNKFKNSSNSTSAKNKKVEGSNPTRR
jgi:hypothetical protein